MGYTETPHNYHVCFQSLRMKFVWRDVKFDEYKAMLLSLEREIQTPQEEEFLAPKEEPKEFME